MSCAPSWSIFLILVFIFCIVEVKRQTSVFLSRTEENQPGTWQPLSESLWTILSIYRDCTLDDEIMQDNKMHWSFPGLVVKSYDEKGMFEGARNGGKCVRGYMSSNGFATGFGQFGQFSKHLE